MPRKAAIIPNKHLHTTISAELLTKLDLFLWSEVEGRVPQGAYQTFVSNAIRNFFAQRTVDVKELLGTDFPAQVTATPEVLAALIAALKGEK